MIYRTGSYTNYTEEDRPAEVLAFLNEVDAICKRYGYIICHEEHCGGFEIMSDEDDQDNEWFMAADYIEKDKKMMEVTIIKCEKCGRELHTEIAGTYADGKVEVKIIHANESLCPYCTLRKEDNTDGR